MHAERPSTHSRLTTNSPEELLVEISIAEPPKSWIYRSSAPVRFAITVGDETIVRRYSDFLKLANTLQDVAANRLPQLPGKLLFHFPCLLRRRIKGLRDWLKHVTTDEQLGAFTAVRDFLQTHTPPAALPASEHASPPNRLARQDAQIASAMSLLRLQGTRINEGDEHSAHSHALATFLMSESGQHWVAQVTPHLYDRKVAHRPHWRSVLGGLRYMKDLCQIKAVELGKPEARADLMFYTVVHAAHPRLATLLAELERGLGPQPEHAEDVPQALLRADAIHLRGFVDLAKELAEKILGCPPLPEPEGFKTVLSAALAQTRPVYHPVHNRVAPWFDINGICSLNKRSGADSCCVVL